jgi:RHS repeat-associated protein
MEVERAYKYATSKNVGMKILMIAVGITLLSVVLVGSAGAQTNIGSISGYKINDTNGNGRWDAGEKGIPGWHISLIGIAGTGFNIRVVRKETSTDVQGIYKFDNLPAGIYSIIETTQRGWIPTNSIVKLIKLSDGENPKNINFTNRLLRAQPTPTPTPTPPPPPTVGAPSIVSFSPNSPVNDVYGASRTFSITVNQTVKVSWQINGKEIFSQSGVSQSTYTNTTVVVGTWNITAAASNANGTISQKWTWVVAAAPVGSPSIVSFSPSSPSSDTVGATRAFNITFNQTVKVTWYINGTEVFNQSDVTDSSYTNTSAAAGTWNVTVAGTNSNGTASHIWEWIVSAYIPGTPQNLANNTGNFWVNHTWSAGANTDLFNVSVNGNWDNSSNALFRNTTVSAHGWVNISVAGYNSTSHLLSGFVSQDTRIPNNPITITNISDSYSLNEGQTLYIDANYTDVDGDIGTFARNFSKGTFDTSTGILSWTTGAGDAGVYSWQINVTDGYGSVATKEFTVTVKVGVSPPSIISFAPPSPVSNVEGDTQLFNITANQIVNVTWYINGTEVFNQSDVTDSSYTNTSAALGTWNVTAIAANTNGTAMQIWDWNVTQPPVAGAPSIISFIPSTAIVSDTVGATRTFSVTVNQTASIAWYINGTPVQTNTGVSEASYTNTSAAQGTWIVNITATNANGTVSHEWIWNVTQSSGLPPDPITVAPPLDRSVATNIATSTAFLYTGSNPIQTGVANGTIDAKRVAVLRGHVLARDGTNLSGVNISILSHPEFGSTLSRADGMFDMAANGGGLLTVNYEKAGYLTVQRQVNVPWQDYVWLPDVVMIQADANVTAINLSNTSIQVARGGVVNDSDGTRQATILFPQGTQANMTMPDGTVQNLTTIQVRATEYTVGAEGPKAMPAELPPTSAYTYAVELSADEAMSTGAKEVNFNKPVYSYVDNFLNFSAGIIVPVGYYNRSIGQWIPSDNGLVVKILSITNGMADIDVNGSGIPANASQLSALNFTDAERQQLASLYQPGQSLWRVPITHFSIWDYNWSFGWPAPDATGPPIGDPQPDNPLDTPDIDCGSIIGCQNQELGEAVNIAGTPFSLHYEDGRVPGHKADYTLNIPLSNASVPGSLKRIELEIFVAGEDFKQSFPAAPNQNYTFTWDGKDVYGRKLVGISPITVNIGYAYGTGYATINNATYSSFSAFAQYGNSLTASSRGNEIIIWKRWKGYIGAWDARGHGLGGWSLSVLHAYDYLGRVLYLGDGGRLSAGIGINKNTITTIAGNGGYGYYGDGGSATQASVYQPYGVAVSQNGSIYIADTYNGRIRKVLPDGNITTVAGGGKHNCDGGPATQASIDQPHGVAVGPDDSIYIVNVAYNQICKVLPDGNITIFAGNASGYYGYSGDGGPATQALLYNPLGVAVGQDGSVYIADWGNARIRKLGPDGIITTVAGNGAGGVSGDGGTAINARINPNGVAVGQDGSIYIADHLYCVIRKVSPDGIITTAAGTIVGWSPGFFNYGCGYSGDGGPATNASLGNLLRVAIGQDGSIYIADTDNNMIRKVWPDGVITTIAGNGFYGYYGDGGPATQARLDYPQDIAVGSDGSVYIADTSNNRIRQVSPTLPGFSGADFRISSNDDSEIFTFNGAGRHLRTLDALTGAVKYNFTYDSAGRLNTITDGDGNIVTIERDTSGNATAIISPYGQRTSLSLDTNGYIASITDPAGESTLLSYTADGLLTNMTDPRGNVHNFSYDALGRLIRDEDPAGGFKTLSRTDFANGYSVNLSTGLNRNTTYQVDRLSTGDQRLVNTFPNGLSTATIIGTNGSETTTYPDGTTITVLNGPDPRFGMEAPVPNNLIIKTPGGLIGTIVTQRSVTLASPNDPLSLQSLTETTSINGRTYTSIFNAAWKNITTSTPLGRKTVIALDNKDRVIGSQIPDIVPINFTYDDRGRLSNTTQGTRIYVHSYDAKGNLANVTDPLSRTVGYEYDPAGRVTRQTLPDGRQIQYAYDASGNVIGITPPGRPNHAFNYTTVDLLKDYTPLDIGIGDTSTRYTYNIDRQLTNVIRPDGATINYGYDNAGRLSTINYPQGTTSLSYDAATGNLKSITAPDGGTITYAHDGNLLTDVNWSGTISGSIHHTYDNNFSISSESINGGNIVNFQYDLDGLLTQAGLLNLHRDPQNGLLIGSALGNVTDSTGYDGFGDVAAYQAAYSSISIFSVNYTRDNVSRITQKNETINGTSHIYNYTYDLAGRLTNVSMDGIQVSQYAYDTNGNRLSYTSSSGTISGTYDNQDRLLQYGTTTHNYTVRGELLVKTNGSQTTNYQYDVLGNLRNVTLPDGKQISYVIDGKNRRVGKKANGVIVQSFLYKDQFNPIVELDGSGNIVSRFVYASRDNVPDYMVKGGKTYRIITDQLGSPRLVINTNTGEIVQQMDYDEFGNVIRDTNPGFQPLGFAGGLYDRDIRLVRFGARDYDPEIGRWTTKDPILFAGKDTNIYGYVLNDPVNRIDSRGLDAVDDLGNGLADAASLAVGALASLCTGPWAPIAGPAAKIYTKWAIQQAQQGIQKLTDPNPIQSGTRCYCTGAPAWGSLPAWPPRPGAPLEKTPYGGRCCY